MLGRPAVLCPPAEIVGPDDLVQEVFPPKDLIQQDLAVMCLAEVDMEIQTAGWLEHAVGFHQPGFEKSPVILEAVAIIAGGDDLSGITLIAKTNPITQIRAGCFKLPARLHLAGVERWINIDQINCFPGEVL